MGNDFTAEQVDNANNVGEIIAVVVEEINCLKVCLRGGAVNQRNGRKVHLSQPVPTCTSDLSYVFQALSTPWGTGARTAVNLSIVPLIPWAILRTAAAAVL